MNLIFVTSELKFPVQKFIFYPFSWTCGILVGFLSSETILNIKRTINNFKTMTLHNLVCYIMRSLVLNKDSVDHFFVCHNITKRSEFQLIQALVVFCHHSYDQYMYILENLLTIYQDIGYYILDLTL